MRRNFLESETPSSASAFLDKTPNPEFPPAVAQALAEHPWEGEYGLYLWGKPGSGKTVAAYWLARRDSLKFITEKTLIARWRETMNPEANECTEAGLRSSLLYYGKRLVLDDIGGGDFGILTPYAAGVVAGAIDDLYQDSGLIVVTANRAPSDLIPILGARTVSRLGEMCRIVKYDHEDRRLRAAIDRAS
ncbi:MAG TPA: hypothetical protein VGC81_10365 [Candidatus Methylomirabilis sp.]